MSSNSRLDQADGLRRLISASSTQHIVFLSAVPAPQKNAVLNNLAAALVNVGSDVHLLDASQHSQGISSTADQQIHRYLSDITEENNDTSTIMYEQSRSIYFSKLSRNPINLLKEQPSELEKLSQSLLEIKPDINFCLVDIHLDSDNPFLLPELAQADVIVLTNNTPDSIKSAYLQIKALHAQLGRRPYHVLVVGSTLEQAKQIQHNMSLAAKLYLAVPLISLGVIPQDDFLARAAQLGKTVIDAFPTAVSASAFRSIATQLVEKTHHINTPKTSN